MVVGNSDPCHFDHSRFAGNGCMALVERPLPAAYGEIFVQLDRGGDVRDMNRRHKNNEKSMGSGM